jgi:hypothetical protein
MHSRFLMTFEIERGDDLVRAQLHGKNATVTDSSTTSELAPR